MICFASFFLSCAYIMIICFNFMYFMNIIDVNEFCLMLIKGVYPYEYMDSWKRIDETSLPKTENF